MRAVRTVILTAVAAATLVASAGAAMADPSSTPSTTSIVATGSDTIQYLADANSTGYNGTKPANDFYSFDAVNPTTGLPGDTIETKNDTKCSITRPNGSGAGLVQLTDELKTTDGHLCVDLARASRNIKSTDGPVVSYLFAKDLITWSASSTGNGASLATLTPTDLTAIYSCDAQLITSTNPDSPVTWKEVGGTSTDPIVPILPQSSSGTRAQWLTDIKVTTPGSCVVNGTYNGAAIEENEGTNAVFTADNADGLFPFSAGSYDCQVYHTTNCPDSVGKLVLKEISGVSPLTTATPPAINVATFPATYIRGLYYVALNAGSDGIGTDAKPAIPNGTNGTSENIDLVPFLSWLCTTAGEAETTSYGFAIPPGSGCGTLTGNVGPAK